MAGFLGTIMPNNYFDVGVFKMETFENTLTYNDDSAPLSNFSRSLGFAGFAHWCGESDGDAWVIDLNNNTICSIDVGEYEESYDKIAENSYAKCNTIAEFRHYLINEAIDREWISENDRQELA